MGGGPDEATSDILLGEKKETLNKEQRYAHQNFYYKNFTTMKREGIFERENGGKIKLILNKTSQEPEPSSIDTNPAKTEDYPEEVQKSDSPRENNHLWNS